MNDKYVVSCRPLMNINELQVQWTDLETRSANSFFVSWSWIGTWLSVYKPRVDVLRISHNSTLVGLALLAKTEQTRFHALHSKVLLMHQLGDVEKDQIWIEYNNFLTDKQHSEAVAKSAINYILSEYSDWDEFIVGAITEKEANRFSDLTGLTHVSLWQAPSYGANIAELRENKKNYLSTLSKNTRYQIRRSAKGYNQQGAITLERAESVSEALYLFEQIAPLHIKRWGKKSGDSGFTNRHFVNFHQALIKAAWPRQQIDIWKLSAGTKAVGFFYDFLYQGQVYFYLSGLVKEQDNKLRPGLLGHSLCIEQYLAQGFDYYDFMGGDERYKANLGEMGSNLYKISLQKPKLKFQLEQMGRKVKNTLMRK